ncbi:hypothetical protein GQ53DRAFT_647827, partial [Thozetella sp. PMI_491]
VEAAKHTVMEATDKLHHLLLGPVATIVDCPGDQYFMLGIQYIYRHKIAALVPSEGETSFDEIAELTGQPSKDVTCILRSAMGRHVFREPRKGFVAHMAASRVLACPNAQMHGWVTTIAEQFWPALPRVVDAGSRSSCRLIPGTSFWASKCPRGKNAIIQAEWAGDGQWRWIWGELQSKPRRAVTGSPPEGQNI